MTPPIVCIVGKKKSGKTTFLEKLLPELRALGVRVGTVKHDAHSFEVDREGKDSWRHRQAGAETVVISSPERVAVIKRVERERSLSELAEEFFADRDLVVAEGYFRSDHPKIEVHRAGVHDRPLCLGEDAGKLRLLAVVSDLAMEAGAPMFGLDEAAAVAALVVDRLLGGAASACGRER